jgi:hypothetical protein
MIRIRTYFHGKYMPCVVSKGREIRKMGKGFVDHSIVS